MLFVRSRQSNVLKPVHSQFYFVEDMVAQRRGTDYVYSSLSDGTLRLVIYKVQQMEGHIEAWQYLQKPRQQYGKVVIETGAVNEQN